MEEHGSATSSVALLWLDGFVVLAAAEVAGEVELLVETTATVTGCPRCGGVAEPHGPPSGDGARPADRRAATVLVWSKRLWRCSEPRCAQRTWTETSQEIRPRAVLTERARVWRCAGSGVRETVASVQLQLGVGWHTVWRAVREYGQPLVDDRTGSTALPGLVSTSMCGRTPAGVS